MSKLFDRRRPAVLLAAVVLLSGALIGASRIGSVASSAPAAEAETSPFAGIPQRGLALGDASAPVTIVEYADLQCPYCAEWARSTLPVLVEEYVRPGKVRIVFTGGGLELVSLTSLGPEGLRPAIDAALAS